MKFARHSRARRGVLSFGLALLLFSAWAATSARSAEVKEEEKPQIAVWDFNLTEMSNTDGQAIANSLRSALVNTRVFRVMTRDQIDTLLGEQALGQTLIDAKEAIRAGKLKGVKYVVTGSLIAIRGAYQGTFEMIDGGSGEIVHSITPRTFRGEFLDFLDIEVPKIATQMAGVEAGAVNIVAAPKTRPPPPEGGAKTIVYIPPGDFAGNGARSFEKENAKLVSHLKEKMEREFPGFLVIRPFEDKKDGNAETEKMRRQDLRKTLWRGLSGFGLGAGQPNLNFLKNLAEVVRIDLTVLVQTQSDLFSGGDSGEYTVTIYSPNTFLKIRREGDWRRKNWMEDIWEGVRESLKTYRSRR